ncbi:MAG: ribonuclease PH [Caldilineaceae bacterium]|nr:ribonuclease PH [Caldilineaceae bacterium]
MSAPNRAFDELRPVQFDLDYIIHPEGSVLVSMGDTRVLCNATVQEFLPRWLRNKSDKHGWVTAEYALLPRSTHSRVNRETMRPKGRTQEIQRLIGRSLRGAMDLHLLGERQIIVDCDVLQADGGTRTASVTGGYVALALAVKRLMAAGALSENPIRQAVAAVSVGMIDGIAHLDLNYELDLAADVDMNVVMTADGRFIEVQGTAEGASFSHDELQTMLGLAERGIRQLLTYQAAVLENAA